MKGPPAAGDPAPRSRRRRGARGARPGRGPEAGQCRAAVRAGDLDRESSRPPSRPRGRWPVRHARSRPWRPNRASRGAQDARASRRPRASGPAGRRPSLLRRPGRGDDPAGENGRRSRAGMSTSRAGPSRAGSRSATSGTPGGRPVGLARSGPGTMGIRGPWHGLEQLHGGDRGRHRSRRPVPPDRLGRDRVAELIVACRRSPRPISTPPTTTGRRSRDGFPRYGDGTIIPDDLPFSRFEYAAVPTQPIEGVIRDKDTGRPIAGVDSGVVDTGAKPHPRPGRRDDERRPGTFSPLRPQQGDGVPAVPRAGRGPALSQGDLRVPAGSPALEAVNFDIALKRGILVRGRVTDKVTGRPVPGIINAYAFGDNPHVREFPGYERAISPMRPVEGRRSVRGRRPAGPWTHHCLSDQRRTGSAASPGNQGGNPPTSTRARAGP